MTPDQLYPYQKHAVNFQCVRPESALWLDMGLGKTIITLTSISYLIKKGYLSSVLVVAPIRVIRLVWRQEALKWTHTQHLTFSLVSGAKDRRTRALLRPANIYLINYENLRWLTQVLTTYFIKKKKEIPFNGVVWDEISKMKNSGTKRVMAVKKTLPLFKWKTGLTGTPAANGYRDLHGQYLVLDEGKRLGTSKTQFRSRFYYKVSMYKEVPFPETESQIKQLIGGITLEMSAKDYNPLPDLIINNIELEMSLDIQNQYNQLEKQLFVTLDNGVDIEVFNAAALTNKALQFANGAVYPIPGLPQWEPVHDLKLEALEDVLEEAGGSPVLCAYAYRSDAARIMSKFKTLKPINLTECKSEKSLNSAMDRWARSDCPLMIGHPESMGHGIDRLQDSGHILCWYGLNWSRDLYDQFNARICRQGQSAPVICHRLLVKNTLEEAQSLALEEKGKLQSELRKAIKTYREQRGI